MIEKSLSFLVSSSLFIATSCLLNTYFSFMLYNTKPSVALLFSAFFTMLAIYSFNKLTDKEEDAINRPERADYIQGREKPILFISIFSYIIALTLVLLEGFLTVSVVLFPLVSGYVYSVKISKNFPRLKDITGVNMSLFEQDYHVISTRLFAGKNIVRIYSKSNPHDNFKSVDPILEDVYFYILSTRS